MMMMLRSNASRRAAAPVRAAGVRLAGTRVETDTFGPLDVPEDRYWGAQTQRSLQNFKIGGPAARMPEQLVRGERRRARAGAEACQSEWSPP